MKAGDAYIIFCNIGNKDMKKKDGAPVTEEERMEAIRMIADLPTHNGVTKDAMVGVIRFLLEREGAGK